MRARLWPSRLQHQMLLLIAVVMTVATAGLYRVSSGRLLDVADDATRQWAESLARTAASAAGDALERDDATALEARLRDLASLPGVVRLDVADRDNLPRLSLLQAASGRVGVQPRDTAVVVPGTGAPRARRVSVGEVEALQVWAPAGVAGRLGSIGVTVALEPERDSVQRLRYDAVAAIAVVGLLTLVAAHLMLQRTLVPLQRLARFSQALAAQPGGTLAHDGGSREVAELTDALNRASTMLAAQWQEIVASRERAQAILDAVPDAVIGLDADGSIGFLSPAAASVFGVGGDGPAPRRLHELVPELDGVAIEERLAVGMYVRSSGTRIARFESQGRRADGCLFPAEVTLSRTENQGRSHDTCVVRDITEQRYAMNLLKLSQRALDCTTNGVVISDMTRPGQPVFYANPAFCAITGYAPHEVIGRNCGMLQRGDTAQPELAKLREAIRAGASISVVLRNYRKDGSLFFNELSVAPVTAADGSVPHYVGVLSDVTERERARLAIAERSARLNAVFDLSPDGFVVFDREGQLVYTNRAFVAMTGMNPLDSGRGTSLADFDREFALSCVAQQPYRAVTDSLADDAGAAVVLSIQRPQRRVLTRNVRRQDDGAGETILYFRDVTHETEVDRMKSEFLTTAAHELRTPMVSVFGFTELLLKRAVPEERRRDMLETIHRQASLLIHMVNELLDLARIEARQGKDLVRQPSRLGDVVAEAVAGFAAHPDGGERLQLALAHADSTVFVDPEKTHRVFTNVLSNAFKYSPQGGPVTVHSRLGQVRGAAAVGVVVRDRGIGMTREQVARVFERFYRADPSGNIPGTGLGMSLVKEIVELQGGVVEVDSQPGDGTQVTVWLPLHGAAVAAG